LKVLVSMQLDTVLPCCLSPLMHVTVLRQRSC
jgi:hypothetical protein